MSHPKNPWTHPMCRACWDTKNPGREAVLVIGEAGDVCCWCGDETDAGIYIRADPAALATCSLRSYIAEFDALNLQEIAARMQKAVGAGDVEEVKRISAWIAEQSLKARL